MTYIVTYTNSAFPADHEFEIRGLGVLINGQGLTVTPEMEQAFIDETGKTLAEGFDGQESIKLVGNPALASNPVVVPAPAPVVANSTSDKPAPVVTGSTGDKPNTEGVNN